MGELGQWEPGHLGGNLLGNQRHRELPMVKYITRCGNSSRTTKLAIIGCLVKKTKKDEDGWEVTCSPSLRDSL